MSLLSALLRVFAPPVAAVMATLLIAACAGCGASSQAVDGADRVDPHDRPAAPDLRAFRMAPPPPMTRATTIRLAFRTPPLATRFAVLQACVRASLRAAAPGCAPLRARLDVTGRAHLHRFGAVHARFLRARGGRRVKVDPAHPLAAALLPPAQLQAFEAFAEPFFRFATLAEVFADLRLSADDQRALVATFAWFQSPLDQVCADLARSRPEIALAIVARWARLDAFLALLARFYGVSAKVPYRLSVDLVWSPAGYNRATAWAGRAVVAVNASMFPPAIAGNVAVRGFDRAGLARTLGVVVHEFGHTFASLLPWSRRQALTDRIAGQVGVLNGRHANVLDEAVQTAAGNILFLRSLPTWTALDRVLYAHQAGQRWPAAIDRLARHLALPLARHLATPAAFDGPFIDAALAQHARVFGRQPMAFARACVVIGEDHAALSWWPSFFPAVDRQLVRPDALGRQRAWLQANPWLTRWFLVHVPRGGVAAAWPKSAGSPALMEALACLKSGAAGCFIARRRSGAAGWDLALAATDAAASRQLMERLRSSRSLRSFRVHWPQPLAR